LPGGIFAPDDEFWFAKDGANGLIFDS
jgi:hypothetical protein